MVWEHHLQNSSPVFYCFHWSSEYLTFVASSNCCWPSVSPCYENQHKDSEADWNFYKKNIWMQENKLKRWLTHFKYQLGDVYSRNGINRLIATENFIILIYYSFVGTENGFLLLIISRVKQEYQCEGLKSRHASAHPEYLLKKKSSLGWCCYGFWKNFTVWTWSKDYKS